MPQYEFSSIVHVCFVGLKQHIYFMLRFTPLSVQLCVPYQKHQSVFILLRMQQRNETHCCAINIYTRSLYLGRYRESEFSGEGVQRCTYYCIRGSTSVVGKRNNENLENLLQFQFFRMVTIM